MRTINLTKTKLVKTKKTLGVLGGMGVQATAMFYTMLNRMQTVSCEQEYIDVIIYSKPSIPDRTAFITGRSDKSPVGTLLEAAHTLEKSGVDYIAMPCVTAHFFYDKLNEAVSIPFINMMEETAIYVQKSGYTRIGLLATDGTLEGRLFHKAFAQKGIEVLTLTTSSQTYLRETIYKVKAGQVPIYDEFTCDTAFDTHTLDALSAELCTQGAQAIVLGCTELGLLPRSSKYIYIEAMEVLAMAALKACLS